MRLKIFISAYSRYIYNPRSTHVDKHNKFRSSLSSDRSPIQNKTTSHLLRMHLQISMYQILTTAMNYQASYDVRNFWMTGTADTILRSNLCMESVQYDLLLLCPHTKQNIVQCLYGTELRLSIWLGIIHM